MKNFNVSDSLVAQIVSKQHNIFQRNNKNLISEI